MNYRGNEKVSNRVQLSALPSKKQFRYIFAALLAVAVLLGGPVPSAYTAAFVVDSTVDAVDVNPGDGVCATLAGECTLRAAIMETNALAGTDSISVPAGTYTLTLGSEIRIDDDLNLLGHATNSTIIEAATQPNVARWRVFFIPEFRNNVTISNVTIRHANPQKPGFHFIGGGISSVNSTLTLINTTVRNNKAAYGGGVGLMGGQVTLVNSTISNNTAGSGGGIHNGGTLTVLNSTISANFGGGIGFSLGSTTLGNTIVAGNFDGPDCRGFTSLGYNLIGDITDCTFTPVTGDIVNADPLIGPLTNNGGPTDTHALLQGSPAIDGGNPTGCTDQDGNPLATDQRGIVRPQGDTCDIGAFEFEVVEFIQVSIDVKPGGGKNSINLSSRGKVPVGVLTTSEFDAGDVDPVSVTFADASPIRWTMEDVDGDGDTDLLFHFKTQELNLGWDSTEAILTGSTYAGVQIRGVDTVNIVPKD